MHFKIELVTFGLYFIVSLVEHFKPLSQRLVEWICLLYGLNGYLNLVPSAIIILQKLLVINFRNLSWTREWNEGKKTGYLGTISIRELVLGTHENGSSQSIHIRNKIKLYSTAINFWKVKPFPEGRERTVKREWLWWEDNRTALLSQTLCTPSRKRTAPEQQASMIIRKENVCSRIITKSTVSTS